MQRNQQRNQRKRATPTGSRRKHASRGRAHAHDADQIRDLVRRNVGRGLAAVIGLFEGVRDEVRDADLPNTARSAVRGLGRTARSVVETGREETDAVRQAMRSRPGASASRPRPKGRKRVARAAVGRGRAGRPRSRTSRSSRSSRSHARAARHASP